MEDNSQTGTQLRRRRDLDAVGNLVVLGIVFFHTLQIFSPFGLFIKNAPPNLEEISQRLATTLIFFATLWGMPLMFLIAGMAIWFSLQKRTAAEFARERVGRLLVPFLVGLLIFIPLNQYIILKQQHPQEAGTYWQFLRTFINFEFDLTFPVIFIGASDFFSLSHLWFLIYLFLYSLLLLPLFLYLRKPAGRRLLDRVTSFFARPWAIYLMALPLAVIQAVLATPNAAVAATWNLWAYVLFLTYGFLFAADARFEQAVQDHRKSALMLGILGFLVYLGGFLVLGEMAGIGSRIGYVFLRFLQGMTGWFWILAIMGLVSAIRHKRSDSQTDKPHLRPPDLISQYDKPSLKERIVAYTGEAQVAFYVLHMTPIVVIGYFVVQWEVSDLVKYLVIVLSSLVVTLLLYEIAVRRTRLTRFLFGLKPGVNQQEQTRTKVSPNEQEVFGS